MARRHFVMGCIAATLLGFGPGARSGEFADRWFEITVWNQTDRTISVLVASPVPGHTYATSTLLPDDADDGQIPAGPRTVIVTDGEGWELATRDLDVDGDLTISITGASGVVSIARERGGEVAWGGPRP